MTQQTLFLDPRQMTEQERDAFMGTLSNIQKSASAIDIRAKAWHSMASIWNDNEDIRDDIQKTANEHWQTSSTWNNDFYELPYGQQLHVVGTLVNLLKMASNAVKFKENEQRNIQ